MNKLVALSAVVFAGCFSSLVSDPCASGYTFDNGKCVEHPDGNNLVGNLDGPMHGSGSGSGSGVDGGGSGTVDGGGSGSGCVEGCVDGGVGSGSGSGSGSGVVDGGSNCSPGGCQTLPGDAPTTTDAPTTVVVDAGTPPPPDALVCAAPLTDCDGTCVDENTDPNNCGRCDHVCASGLCVAGLCAGEPVGHVVAIGHDYLSFHAAMARVLGNAIALGRSTTVRVGWYKGTADTSVDASARAAGVAGLMTTGRLEAVTLLAALPDATALATLDVVVIDPQRAADGDALEALGTGVAGAWHAWLVSGGVVVVLEGKGTNSYRLAKGAGLFDLAAPTTVTGSTALVAVPTDAVAQQVPVTYLAETTSVAFATNDGAVCMVPMVGATVVHRTVQ